LPPAASMQRLSRLSRAPRRCRREFGLRAGPERIAVREMCRNSRCRFSVRPSETRTRRVRGVPRRRPAISGRGPRHPDRLQAHPPATCWTQCSRERLEKR
jgi:hypothetical protein